jgi:predicted nucleic acid-binding protein
LQRVRGTVDEALAFYASLAINITPSVVPRVVPDDPDDDEVIAAALAGRADIVVSGDRHLLTLGAYREIKILTPIEALAAITA